VKEAYLIVGARTIPIAMKTDKTSEMKNVKVGEYVLFDGSVLYRSMGTYMDERGRIINGKFKAKYKNSVI